MAVPIKVSHTHHAPARVLRVRCDRGLESIHRNALLAIAGGADDCFYRRAEAVTPPHQRAIALVKEAVSANDISVDVPES